MLIGFLIGELVGEVIQHKKTRSKKTVASPEKGMI